MPQLSTAEPDEEVNGDPDSTLGEDDECGFSEVTDWPDLLFQDDDGFDDADNEYDEESEAEEEDEE